MEKQPKISIMEAYLLIVFAVISDLLNWIPVVNWLVTIVTLPAYQFYFYSKGLKGIYSLIGNLIELIPGASVLPAITIGVVITIIMDRVESTKLGGKILKPIEKATAIAKVEKVATAAKPAK